MLRFIYALPITYIILLLAVMPVVWGYLFVKIRKPHWQIMNGLLAIAAAAAVLYATLISREPGTFSAFQKPFAKLADAHVQPELYREMLMNVFLFFPFGLTLSNALPRKLNLWGKISLTAFIGCALSLGIEYSQYRYAFGMAETDDVICNTLGVFIGSSSLLIAHAIEKQKERSRQAMTTLTQTETQFLTLIRAAVSGGSCPAENVNWHAVFSLASEQKLLPVLFEAALRMPVTEDNSDLFTSTKQKVIGQVLGQTMRSEKFADLYRKLRAEGLHPIVVKGQLCSRLYPLKDYRLSSDDDLYITEDEFFDCHGTLLANGLSADTSEEELKTADEVTYLKKDGSLHIELHRRLFDSSGDADDETNRFFADISPTEIDGYLAMPPHLHLLYLLLHAFKHFVRSGIGLRQFCDIGLWAREYCDQIDWKLLYDQCASVHAENFAKAAFAIARRYLGVSFELPLPWDDGIDAEPLLHDALCSGIYGTNDYTRLHSSTMTLNAARAGRSGKKGGVLPSVFPSRAYMEKKYPYVRKHPALLPAAWIQRIVRYALSKEKHDSFGSVRLGRERIELLKLYGIIDFDSNS